VPSFFRPARRTRSSYRKRRPYWFGSALKRLPVEASALTLTGASITARLTLALQPTTLTLAGKTIVLDRSMPVAKADLTLTGKSFLATITIAPLPASLSLTGAVIDLRRHINVGPATLTLTGYNIDLPIDMVIPVTPGLLTLTGADVALRWQTPSRRRAPLLIPARDGALASLWSGMPAR
jgi:hypothetical protein